MFYIKRVFLKFASNDTIIVFKKQIVYSIQYFKLPTFRSKTQCPFRYKRQKFGFLLHQNISFLMLADSQPVRIPGVLASKNNL